MAVAARTRAGACCGGAGKAGRVGGVGETTIDAEKAKPNADMIQVERRAAGVVTKSAAQI